MKIFLTILLRQPFKLILVNFSLMVFRYLYSKKICFFFILNPFVTTRDYSRVSVKSLTSGLCDVIAAVIQQETHPPYTSCLANQRERDQTHTAHTTASTKQGILNNCNVYMSQVVHHSVKIFLTQILFKSVNINTEEGYWL